MAARGRPRGGGAGDVMAAGERRGCWRRLPHGSRGGGMGRRGGGGGGQRRPLVLPLSLLLLPLFLLLPPAGECRGAGGAGRAEWGGCGAQAKWGTELSSRLGCMNRGAQGGTLRRALATGMRYAGSGA